MIILMDKAQAGHGEGHSGADDHGKAGVQGQVRLMFRAHGRADAQVGDDGQVQVHVDGHVAAVDAAVDAAVRMP